MSSSERNNSTVAAAEVDWKLKHLTSTRDGISSAIEKINDIEDFSDSRAASEEEYSQARENLLRLAKAIDLEATKFAVGVLAASKEDQCTALCRDFRKPVEMFADAIRGVSTFTRTKTLRACIRREGNYLLHASLALAGHAVDAANRGESKTDPAKAGHVFECCKKLRTNLPKSDKIAVKRAVLKSTLEIKDTADEFAESLKGHVEDSFVGDEMFEEDEMTDDERETVSAAVRILRRCQRLCKASAAAMTSLSASPSKGVSGVLDRVVATTTEIAARVVDVGCALYTPIEGEGCVAVLENVGKILKAVDCLQKDLLLLPPLSAPEQRNAVIKICDGIREARTLLKACKLLQHGDGDNGDGKAPTTTNGGASKEAPRE